MDKLIKSVLQERAAEATFPPDAWERQKALLLASGLTEGRGPRRPWWRRWETVFEVAAVGVLMLGLITAGIIAGPLRTGGQQKAPPVAATPTGDDLNPWVSPPAPHFVLAPDLPQLTPPEGSLTQAQIIAAAEKHIGAHGGQVTLAHIAVSGSRWTLAFQGDGLAIGFSGGPATHDRKSQYSHVSPMSQMTFEIDGTTGEVLSAGSTGGLLAAAPAALEHYRGFIVYGGEQLILRLARADGGRDGRDLTVWVPGSSAGAGGLALWQLTYGAGRQVDVWGRTIASGEVLAYRVQMNNPPDEELLDHDLIRGIPLPDGVRPTKWIAPNGAGYELDGYSVATLAEWYVKQMQRYGWKGVSADVADQGAGERLRFAIDGWQYAEVAIYPREQGVQFDLTWGMTPLANQDQAVAAVLQSRQDDPLFQQFPHTTGTARGQIGIGGPSVQWIPATFETRAGSLPDGAWSVELVRSWSLGSDLTTTWSFKVGKDGVVQSLGRSGAEPGDSIK